MTDNGALTLTSQGDREIVLHRVFNAPRRRVFDALTQPQLIRQWFGPRVWSLAVCDVDFQGGGKYRYVMRHATDGTEMGMGGTYLEIAAPGHLVHTETFDDWFAGESLVTTMLTEVDGRTTLDAVVRYPTAEIRDEVVKSNMKEGIEESYDRLAELLTRSA